MPHHPMRLKKQQLSDADARALLANAFYGVLSTVSADGTPYGVPLNHVLCGDKLYFHCAPKGHKLDNISDGAAACFTAVGECAMLPQQFTTSFKSVIAFGTVRRLTQPEDIARATRLLCEKNTPGELHRADDVIAAHLPHLAALEMTVESLTGKQSGD